MLIGALLSHERLRQRGDQQQFYFEKIHIEINTQHYHQRIMWQIQYKIQKS